jgi:spore maturation protein CgeB
VPKNFLCCFNDKQHVDYINEILPNHHKISFFLPHGGLTKNIEEKNKIKSFIEYKKQKSIDIVFAGTFLNDIEKPWHDNLAYPSKLLDEVFELFMYDDYLSIQEAFKIVFDRNKILFSSIGKIQLSNLYRVVQNYIRSYSRILLIKKLSESGLNITICGNGWENFAKEHKNINYIGALDIKENLELIKKAKVLINVTPTLRNGSHERVFTGMLNNTVLFSDRSRYYDEFFEDEKNILYYSFNSLNDDIKKLKEILKDDKKLFDISQSAYKIVVKNHTWENRVDTMLEMVNLSKLMDK